MTSLSSKIIHNSFDLHDRNPFGAVMCEQDITLRIKIQESIPINYVHCNIHVEGMSSVEHNMVHIESSQGMSTYTMTTRMPKNSTLLWYYFIIYEKNQTYYYGKSLSGQSGIGEIYSNVPPAYQITVYKPSTKTPNWFKDSVMYQIFVDRFYNGNPGQAIMNPKKQGLIHSHWDNTPFYIRDVASNRVVRWDFFGGNLLGVMEKLPYLKDLGIKVIYFNPIFEAPSNHKYDTGDYHKIDPMFGTNELFQELCSKAEKMGISIILDGVFSHTGSDSIYFNREGNYPSLGAYQSKESPYYPWYRFDEYPDKYESWWGVDVMPNVNELDPTYQEFIISGKNSVLKHWLSLGAKGWRLDVADELPDEFIKNLWSTMKEIDEESILIGEVWEDATNKVSYGERRGYLLGEELDSVMNYPFRDTVLDFIQQNIHAEKVYFNMMGLYENYPKEYFYSTMNLLGTHDSRRLLTVFNENKKQLKLAVLWQMTFPGVPCVYYGDEVGVTGEEDPMNRKTYPWGNEDKNLLSWYKQLIALRNQYDVLQTGSFEPFYYGEHVFGYIRQITNDRDVFNTSKSNNAAIVLFNVHNEKEIAVQVDVSRILDQGILYDALDVYQEIKVIKGMLHVVLQPLEGKILIADRWKRAGSEDRKAGVLLHPTSLPSEYGIGDLGKNAYQFVDDLVESGQKLWQVLPLNPVGYGESPYQCFSAFAGNPLLIDVEHFVELGLLNKEDIVVEVDFPEEHIDFEAVKRFKSKLFTKAHQKFLKTKNATLHKELMQFKLDHASWLSDYSLFMALKQHFDNQSWVYWETDIALRDEKAIAKYEKLLKDQIELEEFVQYIFSKQWNALKTYANKKAIQIIGDMPIYVAHDSCDVWLHPHLFKLDEDGQPTHVSGVPPDYFSKTGQLWGNPIYKWEVLKQDNYAWWVARIKALQQQVDYIRIDHFRAFADFWEIPASAETAIDGEWSNGPAAEFFDTIREIVGDVPFIAEDLGLLSVQAHELKRKTEFPGMQIMQFEIGADPKEPFCISLADKNTVAYTGTHDNDTVLGWYEEFQIAISVEGMPIKHEEICWTFIEKVYKSDADTAVIPLQDILCLGSDARMNIPGTTDKNWSWRFTEKQLTSKQLQKLKTLTTKYRR